MRGVAVIIPAHNEADVLEPVLRSVLAQGPDELLVVADSCTDQTVDVARRVGAPVVAVRTRNVAANRNFGARQTRSDILVFLDADSVPGPGYLDAVRTAVAAGADYGAAALTPGTPHPISRWRCGAMNLISRLTGWFYGTNTFCTRAAFARVRGYDEAIGWGEDTDLTIRLRCCARPRFLRQVTCAYCDRRLVARGYLRETIRRCGLGGVYLVRALRRVVAGALDSLIIAHRPSPTG